MVEPEVSWVWKAVDEKRISFFFGFWMKWARIRKLGKGGRAREGGEYSI